MPAPFVRIALLMLVLAAALAAPAAAKPYPETIPLPDGWQPEGIANRGDTFFAARAPPAASIAATCAPARAPSSCPARRAVRRPA